MTTLDIDKDYEGMITSEDQIIVGVEIWHVYGHLKGLPKKEIVTSTPHITGKFRSFDTQPVGWRFPDRHFLGDIGITEKPFNHNRIFTTEESALAYIEKCIEAGVREA